jgi:hypothetical protein
MTLSLRMSLNQDLLSNQQDIMYQQRQHRQWPHQQRQRHKILTTEFIDILI